jgi:hypothetical protein
LDSRADDLRGFSAPINLSIEKKVLNGKIQISQLISKDYPPSKSISTPENLSSLPNFNGNFIHLIF